MRLPNGRVPPGGWWHDIAPGVTLRAATKELLIKVIFEYKLRNNIPQGDIDREIDAQYCTRYPDACYKEPQDSGLPAIPGASNETIFNRVARWAAFLAAKMPRGGIPLIGEGQALERAKVCQTCQFNVPWRGGCASCSRSTATLLMQIKGLRKNEMDGKIWACQITGSENSVNVHLQQEFVPITDSARGQLPERCWRKKEP